MKRRLPRLLVYVMGYPSFFMTCLVFFAYTSFPYDRLRDFVVQRVESTSGPDGRLRPSGYHLEIAALRPSWITGAELTGVRFRSVPERPGDPPLELSVDTMTVRASLLSALRGEQEVSFSAGIGNGVVEGEVLVGDEQTRITASLANVDLNKLGVLRGLVGLPVTGSANGALNVVLAAQPDGSSASADVTISGLSIGDGRAKLTVPGMSDGLTIERINAGTLRMRVTSEAGTARIAELASSGPDVELSGSGSLRLIRPISTSRLDLLLKVKFKDAYKQRSDRTRGLFSLLEVTPRLRSARTPDGSLQFRLSGSLGGRMSTTPAGGRSSGAGTARARPQIEPED